MTVRPLHDRIVVQRIDEGEQHVGGIIIPDTAKEKPQQGTVIAAGNGKVRDDSKPVPHSWPDAVSTRVGSTALRCLGKNSTRRGQRSRQSRCRENLTH
jgi:hypothetical protein